MMNYERILVLAPHTDDAELGCGGAIARFLSEGREVFVAAFSTAKESLPTDAPDNLLRQEFEDSMRIMGVPQNNLFVYDYVVRKLSYSRQELLEDLVRLRARIKPDIVFLPSVNDLHQDHQALHAEGMRAFKDITVWGYELPWNHITFSAQAFIVLSPDNVEAKWLALQAYKSQIQLERPYFTQEFVQSLAVLRGLQVKARYAEAFEVMKVRL